MYVIDNLLEQDVILDARIDVLNDSFTHAFGTQNLPDYAEVQSLDYNRSLFTECEQRLIDDYIAENYTEICRAIEDAWEDAQTDIEFWLADIKDEY